MKVGILTFQRAYNYGAVLQAFALRKCITNLGHYAEVIDYGTIGETPRFSLATNGIKSFVSVMLINLFSLFNADLRRFRFRKFRKTQMGISKNSYPKQHSLKEAINLYDYFVTGSDQVWNPFLTQADSSFLLDFVVEPKRKISYAASFGVAELPLNVRETFINNINKIKNLSVREKSGQEIIKELTNRESFVAIDPTLLLNANEWDKIAKPFKTSKPYILLFAIMDDPLGFIDFCIKLKDLTGYQLIRIANPVYKVEMGIKTISMAGPCEFVGLIKNASIVVTNSFHGTAFSIIYNKPFYTFLYNNDRDIRLKDLTDKLGLSKRLIDINFNYEISNHFILDYTEVNITIEKEKKQSISYLKEALLG